MDTDMKKTKELLQSRGLKPTYQRMRILKYLGEHQTHPTVEMIYQDLVQEIPTISKTTIYNTLNTLLEKGIIHVITITGTESRYDFKSFPHHHFLCTRCGRIIDIDVDCPYLRERKIGGHKIEELHGYFKGICRECLSRKRKK